MKRRGGVLIEVVLAMAILAWAGAAAVTKMQAVARTQVELRSREAEYLAAERVMISMLALTRGQLEQRLGARVWGEYVVFVDRPESALFRIGVARSEHPTVELLVALVHRG